MSREARHVSSYINAFIDHLPEEMKKKVLVDRKIRQVQDQFAECVEPFFLEHVNSIYLIREKNDAQVQDYGDGEEQSQSCDVRTARQKCLDGPLKLTVYVDNSSIAAELNARRELIVLKYRELFGLEIDEFIIRISRGDYRKNHPYLQRAEVEAAAEKSKKIHRLTPEEEEEILARTSNISDSDIRAAFIRALKAEKEHPLD